MFGSINPKNRLRIQCYSLNQDIIINCLECTIYLNSINETRKMVLSYAMEKASNEINQVGKEI